MRQSDSAHWRIIYIARDERQAQTIEDLLREGGFMVDRKRSALEDIEIRALAAEAEEARMYLMEKGY